MLIVTNWLRYFGTVVNTLPVNQSISQSINQSPWPCTTLSRPNDSGKAIEQEKIELVRAANTLYGK